MDLLMASINAKGWIISQKTSDILGRITLYSPLDSKIILPEVHHHSRKWKDFVIKSRLEDPFVAVTKSK